MPDRRVVNVGRTIELIPGNTLLGGREVVVFCQTPEGENFIKEKLPFASEFVPDTANFGFTVWCSLAECLEKLEVDVSTLDEAEQQLVANHVDLPQSPDVFFDYWSREGEKE